MKGVRNVTRRFLLTIGGALALTAILTVLPAGAFAQTKMRDISGNWAAEHITALVNKGVVHGYPDGTFRPNRTVTRAEFAAIMVNAFGLPAADSKQFPDMKNHWAIDAVSALQAAKLIEGYEDGTFRPNNPVTRAEMTAMVVRALKLEDASTADPVDDSAFSDLSTDHWASKMVGAANRLDILPPYFEGQFRPTEKGTRAETAAIVNGALRLQVAKGVIDAVDSAEYTLSVKTEQNTLRDYSLLPTTTIFRNASGVESDQLRTGDSVYVVADQYGSPMYVKANGLVTQDDVVNKVSNVTKGLLTPEQLKAAIRGDWPTVADGFQVTLYNQLLDLGATPIEADSIMQKDWGSVQGLGRERLTKALGATLHLSDELVVALMDKDWRLAQELAQAEAMQAVLGRLLFGA